MTWGQVHIVPFNYNVALGRGGSILTKKFKSAAKARQVVKSLDDEKKG